MSDLAAFLLARIDEDQAVAENSEPMRLGVWARTVTIRDRVLAECDAKRRIVELHSGDAEWCGWTQGGTGTHDDMGNGPSDCDTLRLLALPFADHPDFRGEWRL